MSTDVDICNIALGWLGGSAINSLSDDTTEADLCNRNYAPARDAVLEDRDWSFATVRAQLSKDATYPGFGSYTGYSLPNDHIRTIQVSDDPDFEYHVDWIKEKQHILAIKDTLYIRYIFQETTVGNFSPNFIQCLALRIAHNICVPLTKNAKLQEALWEKYLLFVEYAGAIDGIQGGTPEPLIKSSELLNAR